MTKPKTEVIEPDNAPGVIAYRVGQLEQAVTKGFKDHNDKLDTLINNFATKEEVNVINRRLDNWTWYFRALVVAVLTALGTAGAALIAKK